MNPPAHDASYLTSTARSSWATSPSMSLRTCSISTGRSRARARGLTRCWPGCSRRSYLPPSGTSFWWSGRGMGCGAVTTSSSASFPSPPLVGQAASRRRMLGLRASSGERLRCLTMSSTLCLESEPTSARPTPVTGEVLARYNQRLKGRTPHSPDRRSSERCLCCVVCFDGCCAHPCGCGMRMGMLGGRA